MNFKLFKHILPATAVVLSAGLSSCVGDLDVTPIDPSTTMEVNEPSLYTKCYATMALAGNTGANGDCDIDGLDGGTTGFVRQLWNANELTTDEAICAWGDPGIPQFNYNQWDASHPMLQGFYYRLTTSISYCNLYLDKCAGVDATREAEVRFLRALFYYHLMDCFGNVPFSTEVALESPKQIARADLFKWIESELNAVVGNMLPPAARTSANEGYGRADQDAVNLLLARMYLNAEVYTGTARWAEAKEYAEKVINGPHKLWTQSMNGWSAYQMLFMGDNGKSGASQEAILPLLQDGNTTTSWGTSLFVMASCWKDDMDVYGDYGTKEYWAGNRARKQLIAKFFPNGDAPQDSIHNTARAANDNRALFYGKGRTLEVTKPSEFTSGFSVGKFRNTYSTGANPHNSQFVDTDYFLMRAAEAYLIAAEADLREDNNLSDAGLGYINALRSRANASAVTKDNCTLDYILDERSRELYYEGFRRTDLIRYGYFASGDLKNLWEWKGGVQNGQGFEEFRNVFAIPSEDINANTNLKQNPGY